MNGKFNVAQATRIQTMTNKLKQRQNIGQIHNYIKRTEQCSSVYEGTQKIETHFPVMQRLLKEYFEKVINKIK